MSKADAFFAQNRLQVSQSSSMGDKLNLLIAFEKWLTKQAEEPSESVAEQVTFPLEDSPTPTVKASMTAARPEVSDG